MSKLQISVTLSRDGKHGRKVPAIVDSGSDITVFPRHIAGVLKLYKGSRPTESFKIMGRSVKIWFVDLDIHVPETDCFVRMPVGFAASREDLLHGLLGVDFLQRTGGLLDFGKDRHAIACDPRARGAHSDAPVIARRKRLGSKAV